MAIASIYYSFLLFVLSFIYFALSISNLIKYFAIKIRGMCTSIKIGKIRIANGSCRCVLLLLLLQQLFLIIHFYSNFKELYF